MVEKFILITQKPVPKCDASHYEEKNFIIDDTNTFLSINFSLCINIDNPNNILEFIKNIKNLGANIKEIPFEFLKLDHFEINKDDKVYIVHHLESNYDKSNDISKRFEDFFRLNEIMGDKINISRYTIQGKIGRNVFKYDELFGGLPEKKDDKYYSKLKKRIKNKNNVTNKIFDIEKKFFKNRFDNNFENLKFRNG